MKTLIKLLLIVPVTMFFASCTDLEEDIKGDFTEDFDPANPGVGIKNNVNGAIPDDGLSDAFATVRNGTANHGSYFSISEVSTDEAVITQKGGDWFDGGIWLRTHRHDFDPTIGGINGAWNDTYGGINQCNALLADGGLTTAGSAQVRFLRAYYYWKLMDMFGNIKILEAPGDDPAQSTRTETYNFIVGEINAVYDDLKDGRQDYGRVSKGAADALLARIYLNAHIYKGLGAPDNADLQAAVDHADAVINSGVYTLTADIGDVFAPDNVDDPEHIFVAPYDEATGPGMNLAQMTLHYPSQLTFRLQQQPWNGYSTLEEFYNSYDDGDDRKDAFFLVGPQTDLDGNPILDVAFDPADPDGAAINYTPEINELAPNGSRQAGARFGKFSHKIGQLPEMDNDFPLLRYGEVLLNKAEALCRLNGDWNNAEARDLVNMIRTRSSATEFTTMTEADYLEERGRELFIESLRRTDLIRYGQWGAAWWEKEAHSDDFKNIMPIPQEAILASQAGSNPLVQNPGY